MNGKRLVSCCLLAVSSEQNTQVGYKKDLRYIHLASENFSQKWMRVHGTNSYTTSTLECSVGEGAAKAYSIVALQRHG